MSSRVELSPAAVRSLKRIDAQDPDRLRGAIALLGEVPRPPSTKALPGCPGLRVRGGYYRIIHTISDCVANPDVGETTCLPDWPHGRGTGLHLQHA